MSTNRLISRKRQWRHDTVNTFSLSKIKSSTFCISQLVVAYQEVLKLCVFSDPTVFHFLRERTRREVVSGEQAHFDNQSMRRVDVSLHSQQKYTDHCQCQNKHIYKFHL